MQHNIKIFEDIHTNHPPIHHTTNNVTISNCANITCCIGASPNKEVTDYATQYKDI